jgi:transglutaminase-like putative cysteine protease
MPLDRNEALRGLPVGLPDDIARLKAAGYYEEAIALIDARLPHSWAEQGNGANGKKADTSDTQPQRAENPTPNGPEGWAACLTAEREIMRRIPLHYSLNEEEAVAKMQQQVEGFTTEEFRALVAAGRIDWRFVNGEKHFLRRFDQTLLDCDPAMAARRKAEATAGTPSADSAESPKERRARWQKTMRESGSASARITLHSEIKMSDEAFAAALAKAKAEGRDTVHLRVWLPLPAACPAQSDITLDCFSEPPTHIAAEDAPQRTAYWEKDLAENRAFTAEYSYTSMAAYADPLDFEPDKEQPVFFVSEEAPHIVFTPYLRALAAQLTDGVTDPARKAKRIYDFVTLNVKYHYQPAYFVLDALPDHCARDRRGDCGIMALTFITLCRIAGIPAKWQSGLAVSPDHCGCHDWAMFYIAPKGWMYADCSYGASMARAGEEAQRLHYFGSIDPGRMVANRAFGAPFDPPMYGWRDDPYDNQTGEIEADGVGLYGDEVEDARRVLAWEELPTQPQNKKEEE